jgi:hypothetical protein
MPDAPLPLEGRKRSPALGYCLAREPLGAGRGARTEESQ